MDHPRRPPPHRPRSRDDRRAGSVGSSSPDRRGIRETVAAVRARARGTRGRVPAGRELDGGVVAGARITFNTSGGLDVTATDADGPSQPPESGGGEATWTGELMHPIVAIGGETTGTALRIGEETLELDLRGLRRRPDLDQLAGQRVRITGTLSVRKGVELTTRSIVRVTRIARVRDR